MMTLELSTGASTRVVDLSAYLDAAREEGAHEDAYRWIKAIRAFGVDGLPFRSRFTLRGDSLWWFAELYLHKQQVMLDVFRTLAAFDGCVEAEQPHAVRVIDGRHPGLVAQAAASRGIRYSGPAWPAGASPFRMDARAIALAMASRASRLRSSPAAASRARVAAFVHRAFWRSGGAEGAAESYIGPVLRELERRLPPGEVRYVGVGPQSNFRARRWWDPLLTRGAGGPGAMVAIERYAPSSTLGGSRAIFRARHEIRRALLASPDLRAHAVIKGCDCWPLVREELAGIALLQFPWSARAMDEAAAALDATCPDVAVTYAEAGGWGRALALESRRRDIPLAGLQHGFIYRHWLNYRHEPDEMIADSRNSADRGFPAPALTLLFDRYAADHLSGAGRFPAGSLVVTGSARLDELVASVRALSAEDIERVRYEAGAGGGRALVLLATKEREVARTLPALVAAVRDMPNVQLVIKPHPAETPDVYASAVGGVANIRIAPASASLPALLAAAGAVVTVNSTVAIDALSLGVPGLVIGLPNNLSPFVEAGTMRGAGSAAEIRAALEQLLYNQQFRSTNDRGAGVAGDLYQPDGQAAARSASAILTLNAHRRTT